MQGIGISTFGKIIKRDWLKQHVREFERITGIIEVPELVECLTTSKCDFRKDGTAGAKYYRFNKAAQEEFRKWLEEIHLLEKQEAGTDREAQKLQRVVNHILGEMPDLQLFYGFRSEREGLVQEADGAESGSPPEPLPKGGGPEGEARPGESSGGQEVDREPRGGITLGEGEDLRAARRLRSAKFGPVIRHTDAPERPDISWMEGDTVLINSAHPAYRKAIEKKVLEYHDMFAVALAMLREVPSAQEKLGLLERFMSEWGRV
jgi:hypothetical protein